MKKWLKRLIPPSVWRSLKNSKMPSDVEWDKIHIVAQNIGAHIVAYDSLDFDRKERVYTLVLFSVYTHEDHYKVLREYADLLKCELHDMGLGCRIITGQHIRRTEHTSDKLEFKFEAWYPLEHVKIAKEKMI